MATKECRKCGQEKDCDEYFYKNKKNSRTKDGYSSWCKACYKERSAATSKGFESKQAYYQRSGMRLDTDGWRICVSCDEARSATKNASYCTPCASEKSRLAKKRMRDENHDRLNARMLELGGCADCGETNYWKIDWDHVPGKGEKEFGIAQHLDKKSWRQLEKELEKCEPVCANCHRVRTATRGGWYNPAA